MAPLIIDLQPARRLFAISIRGVDVQIRSIVTIGGRIEAIGVGGMQMTRIGVFDAVGDRIDYFGRAMIRGYTPTLHKYRLIIPQRG